ncbi:M23 family metallopeptidase [Halomonas cerina]|uniref:M23ase beta-sheet core domain-containing protein n=1 Tax=Halomonas cerina TaxID=447424 RepID=A0A839VDC2_9GAMM|nr:M23 family metallopeptidase [Halomonas cerina]MBB3192128.1 hypothetical protein [Halomonas cerina]
MIWLVLVSQIVLPLGLLLWLALAPAHSLMGYAMQVAGVGAFLLAFALVAQWAVVPWWLPRLYAGLFVLAILVHVLRGHLSGLAVLPSGVGGWASITASFVLLGLGAWYGPAAVAGRVLPPVPVVDIANPFGPGTYLVGSGGSREIVNAHLRTLDPEMDRYRPWRGQSYAVDFFGLTNWGTRAAGLRPADPAAYAIFGADLHAPCAGEVMATEDHMPDFQVPDQDTVNRLGNHVLLRCGDAVIVFAHMRQGSVAVSPSQNVTLGTRLGEVGNSGASTEPHLHIHAQRAAAEGDPPISGTPLALRIDGRFLVRNERLRGRDRFEGELSGDRPGQAR